MELYMVNFTTSSRMITFLDSITCDPDVANNRKYELEQLGYIVTVHGPVALNDVGQNVAIDLE